MSLRVNGEEVDQGIIDELFMQKKSAAEMESEVSCCERNDEFMRAAQEDAIDRLLLMQDTIEQMPKVPADRLRESLEKITKLYRESGVSWEVLDARKDALREEVISEIRMGDYLNNIFADLKEPSDEELQQFFEKYHDQYVRPKRARCLHICKFPRNGDGTKSQYQQLNDLRRRALSSEVDFETLAKEHTEREDKQVDMGWTELHRVTSNFEALLFSMRVDEVSPVFFEENAFHLIKLVEIEKGEGNSMEELREELTKDFVEVQRSEALKQRCKTLRKTAEITGLLEVE